MTTVGVVVGRFQVDELHEGHKFLIDTAKKENDFVVAIIGIGPLPTTARKPLPFETRVEVIRKSFPDITVFGLEDHPDDDVWSKNLDDIISMNMRDWEVKLYHSRDSFAEVYTGVYPTVDVPHADLGLSGTLHRQFLAENPSHSTEFARGVIWANLNKFPTVYGTVDGIIFRHFNHNFDENQVLLITKPGREGYMFPGGFADPASDSDEEDMIREVEEECSIIVDKQLVVYLGSKKVQDWRYQGEQDCLRTRLFMGYSLAPALEPIAGDDAETAQWVDFKDLYPRDMNPCHRPLYDLWTKKF